MVTMKNTLFFDVTSLATQEVTDVSEKPAASILRTSLLHGITSRKLVIFSDPAVRNSNLA
jgi:hypothetical protein